MLEWLANQWAQWSDGFKGAVIGGGVLLAVGLLNNLVIALNLGRQHRHDAQIKANERKAEIRRELYPKVIDDIHAMHEFLGSLHGLPIDDGSKDPYMKMLQSTGKLWVVAECKATVLARQYVNAMSESYLSLLSRSKDVRWAMTKVREVEEDLKAARLKLRVAESALHRVDLDRPAGVDVVSLSNDYTDAEGEEAAIAAEYRTALAKANPLRVQYMNWAFDEMERMQSAFVKLICALRDEVGLDSDEESFMVLVQEQQDRAIAAFAKVVEGMNESGQVV